MVMRSSEGRPFDEIRRSTPEQVAEYRRWARLVADGATPRQLRALKRMTQADVAAALGVSQVQVSRIERSGQEVQLDTIRRYVEALGFELDGVQVRDLEHDDRVLTVKLPARSASGARRGRRRA